MDGIMRIKVFCRKGQKFSCCHRDLSQVAERCVFMKDEMKNTAVSSWTHPLHTNHVSWERLLVYSFLNHASSRCWLSNFPESSARDAEKSCCMIDASFSVFRVGS